MVDSIVNLLMPPEEQATQNDISNYIQVEEALDCRDQNKRFFSLLNRESYLNVIISEQSTIISCKLDRREVVVDRSLYSETHETWAIGDRPYQKLSNLSWNSHVRGSELILSSGSSLSSSLSNLIGLNNPHTTLFFELTRSNELNCMGKLKSIHMQHQVFYFNLNQTPGSREPIDGHCLAITCNGSLNQIQMQQTKLLCQCNKSSPDTSRLAQSLISDIPRELSQREGEDSDDVILCDAIYSLEATSPLDYLQVQLQFMNRELTFVVRSVKSGSTATTSAGASKSHLTSGGGASNVSSSTNRSRTRHGEASNVMDLLKQQVVVKSHQEAPSGRVPVASSSSSASAPSSSSSSSASSSLSSASSATSSNAQVDDTIATSSSPNFGPSATRSTLDAQESSSTSTAAPGAPSSSSETKLQFANNNAKVAQQAPTSSQHPSTMLRVRVRVTNFGVAILPHMMTNYTCSYKFAW